MTMGNNVSHPLVKPLCNGFAPRALVHTAVWPSAQSRPQAASESANSSILSSFSQGNPADGIAARRDRKSTRLNSSHLVISYAVFCLKKKKKFNKLHI